MNLSNLNNDKLNALATRLDNLLSAINFEVKGLNQSEGIEFDAFLYTLDINEIPSEENGWALSVNYNGDNVLSATLELRRLWETLHYWLYEGRLVPLAEWRSLWNTEALKSNKPLVIEFPTK